MDYGLITIKFILGMVCLIFQINILGKGNLAPSSAVDQVQNYVLGGIIGGIIYNREITVLQFVMVLQKVLDGQPQILIKNGQVRVEACMRAGMTASELMFRLRTQGVYELSKVKSGILEQNGQLVVIENDEQDVRFPIINDGQINQDVLELIHHDQSWLLAQVRQAGYQEIKDIYLGEYVHGQLHLVSYPRD